MTFKAREEFPNNSPLQLTLIRNSHFTEQEMNGFVIAIKWKGLKFGGKFQNNISLQGSERKKVTGID